MFVNVGLLLPSYETIRALESRRQSALVSQVAFQTFDHGVTVAAFRTHVILFRGPLTRTLVIHAGSLGRSENRQAIGAVASKKIASVLCNHKSENVLEQNLQGRFIHRHYSIDKYNDVLRTKRIIVKKHSHLFVVIELFLRDRLCFLFFNPIQRSSEIFRMYVRE